MTAANIAAAVLHRKHVNEEGRNVRGRRKKVIVGGSIWIATMVVV